MRRFPIVIGSTVAGLAGILSFHSRATGALSHALPVRASSSSQSGRSGSPGSTSVTTQPPSASSTTPGSAGVQSATGAQEQYGYGVLSVRVTVSGSKITDVQTADLQTADSYSQQIADQVVPYLRREVLSAQSANIDGISGATYTSEAYAYSLQSALDKLHFR